jgi:hypothetical protein
MNSSRSPTVRTILRTGLLILIAAGGVDASARSTQVPPTSAPPTATPQEVIAWLDCVECVAELKQIAARGIRSFPIYAPSCSLVHPKTGSIVSSSI